VLISQEAEEAVVQLLERIVGQPAFVFVDAESQVTVASVYAKRAADWSAARRARLREELRGLRADGLEVGAGRISVRKIRREDWAESWKRHFKPLEIGSALLLKPSWSRRQPKKNQKLVVLDPGLSFGTGQHPTTRFCLEQLVAARKAGKPQSFLDVGTGSGILAIAAAKLGYGPVVGFDSDPQAVRIARLNAEQNGVLVNIRLLCQELDRMRIGGPRKYDVVCANLISDLLKRECRRIVSWLKPEGVLVLAGILESQFPQVRKVYGKQGLRLISFQVEKEWASGAFARHRE